MTTFEAATSIAQTLLRIKGQWHGGATAHIDIDRAVFATCRAMGPIADDIGNAVRAELKRRAAGPIC
jgi:hypothetical protein